MLFPDEDRRMEKSLEAFLKPPPQRILTAADIPPVPEGTGTPPSFLEHPEPVEAESGR